MRKPGILRVKRKEIRTDCSFIYKIDNRQVFDTLEYILAFAFIVSYLFKACWFPVHEDKWEIQADM